VRYAVAIGGLLLVGVGAEENGRWGTTLWSDRGFFGVLKVMRDSRFQVLVGGRALQGEQALDPARAGVPLAFYYPTGPAGDVLGPLPDAHARPLPSRSVGVIGLGVGSLAAYARPGDAWTFFEINPPVVGVARDYFTYLHHAESFARLEIEVGDARLRLRRGDAERFDVLVLDAFASDAVPTHLVTREALAVYRRALRPRGVLLAHVSNAHVQLRAVFAALARDAGLVILGRRDADVSTEERAAGKAPSEWVVLTSSLAALPPLPSWQPVTAEPGQQVWTDDFANVLASLRF
jgi:SAM-dependent methyltransferase